MRSEGSQGFATWAGGRLQAVADQVGVHVATVSRWAAGQNAPPPRKRKMIQELGGPEAGSWDVMIPLAPAARRAPPEITPEPASPAATRRNADALQAMVQLALAEIADVEDLSERTRLQEKLAAVIASLGKLTGHAVLSHAAMQDSPLWAELMRAVGDAIEPFENRAEIARAIAAKLSALRGGST